MKEPIIIQHSESNKTDMLINSKIQTQAHFKHNDPNSFSYRRVENDEKGIKDQQVNSAKSEC